MSKRRVPLLVFVALIGCQEAPPPGNNAHKDATPSSVSPAEIPADWQLIAPPSSPNSPEAVCANYFAPKSFVPVLSEDSTELSIAVARSGRESHRDSVKVNGGWLVGYDAGEWGGKIWWRSAHGEEEEIAEDNLFAFIRSQDEVLALTGLAHLHVNEGALFRLVQDEVGTWKREHLMDLPSAPAALTVLPGDTLLLATGKGLVELKAPGHQMILHENDMWGLAETIVSDRAGVVYVGLRSVIARLFPTKNGYREEWLVPTQCRNGVEESYGCKCLIREGAEDPPDNAGDGSSSA